MKLTRKPGITFWLAWHSIAVLALVLLPGLLLLGKPAWSLADTELRFLVGIGISYLTCVLILGWLSRRGQAIFLRDLILVVFAVFGIYFFLLLLTGSYFSRPILLSTFVFAALFILFSFDFASVLQKPVLVAGALVLLVSQFMADDIVERLSGGAPGPHKQQNLIHTEFYDVRATIYRDYIDRCPESEQRCGPPTTNGGGISTFGDGYLLATGEGDLFSLGPDSSNELVTRHVQTRIPLDTEAFRADNGDNDVWLYRVTDILVEEQDDGTFRLCWFGHDDITFHDTWHTSGMRGSGSLDYSVDGAFTPAFRTMQPGVTRPVIDSALSRFPNFTLLAAGVSAVGLGVARRALDELVDIAHGKRPQFSSRTLAQSGFTQVEVARAEARLRSARAFLLDELSAAWVSASAGDEVSLEARTGIRLAAVHAAEVGTGVADTAFTLAGGTAVYDTSVLGRCLRDAHVVTQHIQTAPKLNETIGKVLLGQDVDTRMF